ncbi:energy transducer TonB [Roseivirga misakiensis]|uniref:TonB C-terminal domain-containing protein n=1 Tax=Roseivirga misakiensis TaxID=1563681 RepID=A0A1E5T589_9BACT|nr:energy transducer TonB [Roseivirga misakiensis]OEK06539.1 hypothetical protein BFP71_02390 [Roseivirga misakiensis]
MHQKLFFSLLLGILINFSAVGQRQKIDTAFLDIEGVQVDRSQEFLTYEVRSLDKKKRVVGLVKKYAKNGRLLETFTYKRGIKEGLYQRFHRNGDLMINGEYKNGNQVGFWAFYDQNKCITKLVEYNDAGKLLQTRDNIFSQNNEKDSINGVKIVFETKPEFPGGMDNWNAHLRRHLKFPTAAKRYGGGEVVLSFVVLADGRIVLPKAISSTHPSLTKEGIRVINLSPRWIPAKLDGKPVDGTMNLRIVFRSS